MLPAALAIVACAAATTGPAVAAGPATGSHSLGPIAGDGETTVAWVPRMGTVAVAREDGLRFAVPSPGRCADTASELKLGGGRLALLCWDDARLLSRLAVLDLATRRWHEPPDPGRWRAALGDGLSLIGVGARWLEVATDAGSLVVDVDTGAAAPDAVAATEAVDLDAERPAVPLCAPLVSQPFVYDPPFALSFVRAALTLQRCGSGEGTVLDGPVWAAMLGSGIVSWERSIGNRAARAYLPRCRLTFAWSGYSFGGVAHTRSALYTSSAGEIRRERFPSRCPQRPRMRVTLSDGGERATVSAQMWPTGGGQRPLALRLPGTSAVVPVLRGDGPVELRLPYGASDVTWRVGSRRWRARMPGTDRRSWRLPGPRRDGPTRIAVEARDDGGAVAQRYLLAIDRRP